ncbi:MAG: M24 family metallopeptidase [Anaerolineae bacterium]|nr:M24 family metallopeptidase [Anaerolineae bacterium]
MKSDLDRLMKDQNIDALFVSGSSMHNPPMYYFTGDVHLTKADLIKLPGKDAVLFYNYMERDEAAAAGLTTRPLDDYDIRPLLEETGGDLLSAVALRYKHMLADLGFDSGRMAVYGQMDAGSSYGIFSRLAELVPGLEIVPEAGGLEIAYASGESLLMAARETKDEAEIDRIRRMGTVTVEVVDRTAKFLQSHKVVDDTLVMEDGAPLTIGHVKSRIDLWAAELGVTNPKGCIFAIGQDAGVPHSAGSDDDPLRLGQTIVFDIFLQEAGGGYFFDFTRTWCLGYAPPEVQAVYDDVRAVFDELMAGLVAGASLSQLQTHTCELFAQRGHPTIETHPGTTDGYVHGIAHGLGLDVHEAPSARNEAGALKPGVVVTVEPALYYPERGMGVRLEDCIAVHPDGTIENLGEYPYDLVLPMGM